MTCEKCKKNHATYHLTAREDGQMREAHLCEECGKQAVQKFNFSISDILGGALLDVKPATPSTPKASQVRCPECGITYAEFKSKARLGCANDYEVFRGELLRLLEKIHGSTEHAGKTPRTVDDQVRKENELIRLTRDLDSMVKPENFEKAAEIRDRIRTLEVELGR